MKTGYKFILQRDSGERTVVSSDHTDHDIHSLLELFTDFMRGCGYQVRLGDIIYEPWQDDADLLDRINDDNVHTGSSAEEIFDSEPIIVGRDEDAWGEAERVYEEHLKKSRRKDIGSSKK